VRRNDGPCLLDSSASVALLVTGHEAHGAVAAVVDAVEDRPLGLAGHAWFETFSVLTRLPSPARRSPAEVSDALHRNFPASVFLGDAATRDIIARLGGIGAGGGAVYDALVGAAAASADAELLTRDRRATGVYQAVGARYLLIA
jgi:predicted nucleic acid-binding protein